jgi:hypothetical protein
MGLARAAVLVGVVGIAASCGSGAGDASMASGAGGVATGGDAGAPASGGASAGGASTGGASAGGASAGGGATSSVGSGGGSGGNGAGPPTAAELLALLSQCQELTTGRYKTDDDPGSPANIPVCGLNGAIFWQADMDVDCDGKQSAACNLNTDPDFQDQTAVTDSHGDPLDAASLPYVVVPSPSMSRFDYHTVGLHGGAVIAVIYQGKVEYGVFGDTGPTNIIGEASYAMAASLGIDPDPSTGGTDSGVSYIAFTGTGAVAAPVEDHAAAVTLGEQLAEALLANN